MREQAGLGERPRIDEHQPKFDHRGARLIFNPSDMLSREDLQQFSYPVVAQLARRGKPHARATPDTASSAACPLRATGLSTMVMDISKYGVWFFYDGMTAAQSAEFARTVEKHGYGALWIPEAVGREPFAHAAYLAAR